MSGKKQENKQFINLGIVLNSKGEVLMIRRVKEETGKDGSKLVWAFPGGKQRRDESREQCVKREICDETGYDVEPIRQLSLRVHPQFTLLVAYHLCKLISSEPISNPIEHNEIAEIKWVNPEKIKDIITTDLDPSVKRELIPNIKRPQL
jgi:8-oxo-dGTP diphosphatase